MTDETFHTVEEDRENTIRSVAELPAQRKGDQWVNRVRRSFMVAERALYWTATLLCALTQDASRIGSSIADRLCDRRQQPNNKPLAERSIAERVAASHRKPPR